MEEAVISPNIQRPTQRVKQNEERKKYAPNKTNKLKPQKKDLNEIKISNLPDKDFRSNNQQNMQKLK